MLKIIFEVLGVVLFGRESNVELLEKPDREGVEIGHENPLSDVKLEIVRLRGQIQANEVMCTFRLMTIRGFSMYFDTSHCESSFSRKKSIS